ncbi:MAG: hypothetical protein AB7I25_11410 [Vicinamibacterales bacterium]
MDDTNLAALAEERRAVRRTTVEARRAYTAARREAHRERDAERLELARAYAGPLSIPHDDGFLRLPPGPLADVIDPVLADGNGLIEALGHKPLVRSAPKGDFVARGFLPPSAFALESPYFRLALDERIVRPIAAYLGVVPIVTELDIWYSVYNRRAPKSSQLWHMDPEDTTQIKLWVHLNDIGPASGPFTGLNAADSALVAESVGYDYGDGYRVPDERVSAVVGPDRVVVFEGAAGSVNFIDTSRCFHFGSRLAEGGAPRRALVIQYQTPYAFEFANYLKEAPFRHLATASTPRLAALALGAA